MEKCMNCQKALTHNEIGLHKKLINRGATKYMCKQCLAGYFNIPTELLDKKIEQFKEEGCTLFL